MKKKVILALHLISGAAFLLLSCSNPQPSDTALKKTADGISVDRTPHSPTTLPDRYVVLLKRTAAVPVLEQQKQAAGRIQRAKANQPARTRNIQKVKELLARHKIKESVVRQYYADVTVGFSGSLSAAEVGELKADQEVKGVYQDSVAKLQQEGFAWQTFSGDEFDPYYVEDNVSLAGGPLDGSQKGTWIWIIDSGIDLDHPDLNVQTDEPYAISFTSASPEDTYGHGTMVAGVAAAKNNEFGTCGVSSGATVVPVKVTDSYLFGDGATLGDLLAGLNHVATYARQGDVVNISLAFDEGDDCATAPDTETIRDAVRSLGSNGVWVVSGAGNDGLCDGATKNLPACVDGIRVFTVGAAHYAGSNWGTSVDWVADGRATSTYLNGEYAPAEGTSLAAPVVAGVIHARGEAPVLSRYDLHCNNYYKLANVTEMSRLRFDVDLELSKFELENVSDFDGTEDLFGRFDLRLLTTSSRMPGGSLLTSRTLTSGWNFWSRNETNPVHWLNGTASISERSVTLAQYLTFEELRHIEVTIGGELFDEEGLFNPRVFQCQDCVQCRNRDCDECRDCDEFSADYRLRVTRFINNPTTLASINNLSDNSTFQALKFGSDRFFEMNYYESGNPDDGRVKVFWKVRVKPVRPPGFNCNACHQ